MTIEPPDRVRDRSADPDELLDRLAGRCTFPAPGTPVACAFSGGADSSALIALATHHGLSVTAHHVDHGLRAESAREAEQAADIARRLGCAFELHRVEVGLGPNLEARARTARRSVLAPDSMTGHTADDQAETLVLRLLRGSAGDGLAAMRPGYTHPILALRRHDTEAVCTALGIEPVIDRSNEVADVWRNRVRAELLPLATDIARRDLVPLFNRTSDLLRDEGDFLDQLADQIDATDARALAAAHPVLARRAIRRWLTRDGYPPDYASVQRVLAVANGEGIACEIAGGYRVERSQQHFIIVAPDR